ncbi:unnamed protein product, partial [Brachionus calyciflorus]
MPSFQINQPMLPINMHSNHFAANNNYANQANPNNSIETSKNLYNQDNHQELNYDHQINQISTQSNKTFTLKFVSKKKFSDKFRDYYFLEDYIKTIKSNISLLTVYINKKDELIIKTDNQEHLTELKNWPTNAFDFGITEIVKTKKFYLALHNVDVRFDIESVNAKERLKKEYDIDNTLRMIKKSSGQKLELVKAVTSNEEKFNQMINAKKIKVGSCYIRVSPWKFGITPDQCFKCLEFGHNSVNCNNQEKCLRCSEIGHTHKKCKISDPEKFKCANCGEKHAACSKSCPELIKAVEQKKRKLDQKMIKNNEQFTRVYSNVSKASNDNTTFNQNSLVNIVKLIIDLFKNPSKATAAVNDDPTHILSLISQNLGQNLSNLIGSHMFRNLDQDDPNMINCQSIKNQIKITQIQNLISQYEVDILSLNETFLKTQDELTLKGLKLYREDRVVYNSRTKRSKRGGGVALGIRETIISNKIILSDLIDKNEEDEIVGVEIELENKEILAIFSYYLSPSSSLNSEFLVEANKKYKNLLIIGDLNCISQNWHCKYKNQNGRTLEQILEDQNLYVLNDDTPTYKRSENILDLTICSSNLLKFFSDFKVLNSQISDHNPTLTTFKKLNTKNERHKSSKIDWDKFRKLLNSEQELELNPLSKDSLEKAASTLTGRIQSCLSNSTIIFEYKRANRLFIPVPKAILDLIHTKRKMRKLFKKSQSADHKKTLNAISYKLSKEMKKFKATKIKNEFQELSNFNQGSSSHWKMLDKL